MSGSFTWSAIVRVGSVKSFDKATVITVVHEYSKKDDRGSHKTIPVWNSVVCFNDQLCDLLESKLGAGDLVHMTGWVRTNTFQGEHDEKRRTVDLVVSGFDLLDKHIGSPDNP